MDPLISLIVMVLLFCIAAYGLWWICTKFSMPTPILWICGAILIIIVLVYLLDKAGVYSLHR